MKVARLDNNIRIFCGDYPMEAPQRNICGQRFPCLIFVVCRHAIDTGPSLSVTRLSSFYIGIGTVYVTTLPAFSMSKQWIILNYPPKPEKK